MDVEETTQPQQLVAGRRALIHVSAAIEFFTKELPVVAAELARAEIAVSGSPITVYRERNADYYEVTAGYPVASKPSVPTLSHTTLHAGPVVRAVHHGPYDRLGATYALVGHWFIKRDLYPSAIMWEQYLVGPADTADPGSWRTVLTFPLC